MTSIESDLGRLMVAAESLLRRAQIAKTGHERIRTSALLAREQARNEAAWIRGEWDEELTEVGHLFLEAAVAAVHAFTLLAEHYVRPVEESASNRELRINQCKEVCRQILDELGELLRLLDAILDGEDDDDPNPPDPRRRLRNTVSQKVDLFLEILEMAKRAQRELVSAIEQLERRERAILTLGYAGRSRSTLAIARPDRFEVNLRRSVNTADGPISRPERFDLLLLGVPVRPRPLPSRRLPVLVAADHVALSGSAVWVMLRCRSHNDHVDIGYGDSAMSRHIRLDAKALAFLQRVANNRLRPQSETASLMLSAFEDFLEEIERGSSLVIERRTGERILYGSPVLKRGLLSPESSSASTGRGNDEDSHLVENRQPMNA